MLDMIEYHHSSSDSAGNSMSGLDTRQYIEGLPLVLGTQFDDSASLRQFIRSKAIVENFGVKIKASDRKRVIAICSYPGCPWRVRAMVNANGQSFEVRKIHMMHSCPSVNRAGNKQATSSWVAQEIEEMVKKYPNIPPKQINNGLETKYGLSLPYMRLWRSRQLARDNIFGSVDDNYKWVPTLRTELLKRNPGSHITFEYNANNNSFERIYVSFRVCIDGFLTGCRRLVGLDACHLKSKYLGVLLSANTLDGDNGLFTISFAVADSESKKTWQWFLQNLATSLGRDVEPLSFISDMEKGLAEAIKLVFPNAEHRVCMRHMWKNIKKNHRSYDSHKIRNIVWSASNAHTKFDYDVKMSELLAINPHLHAYLMNLSYKWSKSQFLIVTKNQSNTNNMSESFNSWIGEAREKPVADLVDTIRGMLMEQRSTRKVIAAKWGGELVPSINEYIREITTRKVHFIIRESTPYVAEVEGRLERHEVHTINKECSCGIWQMTGLPCIHAVAFIGTKGHTTWHPYVDEYYHVIRYAMAYEGVISTLPSKTHWIVPDDCPDIGVPIIGRPRGRPRKRRLTNFLEAGGSKSKRFQKCGRCGSWGHHRSTCKNPLIQSSLDLPEVDITSFISEYTYTDIGSGSKLPIRRE